MEEGYSLHTDVACSCTFSTMHTSPIIVATSITKCAIKSWFECQRDSIDTQTELQNWEIHIKLKLMQSHNANKLGAVTHLAYALSNVKATHAPLRDSNTQITHTQNRRHYYDSSWSSKHTYSCTLSATIIGLVWWRMCTSRQRQCEDCTPPPVCYYITCTRSSLSCLLAFYVIPLFNSHNFFIYLL